MLKSKETFSVRLGMLAVIASILFVGPILSAQSPQSSAEAVKEAAKLIEDHRASDAVTLLKKTISRDKTNPNAWFHLGSAYVELKKIKEATQAMEMAVNLDPGYADAHLALSNLLIRSSDLERAAAEAKRAIELQPDNPLAHYTHAFISFRLGAFAEVLEHASAAIQQKADFAEAYLIKGQALINLYAQPQPALDDATRARYSDLYHSAAEPLKKYAELTRDAESAEIWGTQARLLSSVTSTGNSEAWTGREVTSKARLMLRPQPQYTETARQYLVVGTVVLRAVFSANGTVTNIRVYYALPGGLTEQAVRAARKIQFTPALLNGEPVSMWMQLEYNFKLY
jgi:TonB family protein